MQYASETSLHMVTSFIVRVAVTHLFLGHPSPGHPAEHNFGTLGLQLLVKLVARAEGVSSAYPINPTLTTSTDVTTVYLTDSVEDNSKSSDWLALCDVNCQSRNMSFKNYFITSAQAKKLDLRVELT
eukprot:444992-Ditylum_brightwellii.AAC.1